MLPDENLIVNTRFPANMNILASKYFNFVTILCCDKFLVMLRDILSICMHMILQQSTYVELPLWHQNENVVVMSNASPNVKMSL